MAQSIRKKPTTAIYGHSKLPYFNRELSWLSFNRRVLDQAFRLETPLLERLRFLAIVSSNLDEFFEIRVAGLIQMVDSDVQELTIDGLSPREQLRRIHSVVASLVEDQYRCWHQTLIPEFRRERIAFKTLGTLTKREKAWVRRYFDREIFPVLTPLAVDPSQPFPQIGNKTLNVMVSLDYPDTPDIEKRMAILPVPRILPRIVELIPNQQGPRQYIFLSEVIKLCTEKLFPGCRVLSAKAFRITRNSDLYIDEEESENLLKTIEEELLNLRRGGAVRLEIEEGVDDALFKILLDHVSLPKEYVFQIDGPINLLRLMEMSDEIDRPDLKYKPFIPGANSAVLPGETIYDTIDRCDILLQHPYQSFQSVIDFVSGAATDPSVYAIKQTLYRTSGDSPIVAALVEASKNGKQVTALIELKARFDEANNIQWARQMEEAGVHVVYGVVGFKVHAKCSLVVRHCPGGFRHYAHLGTGNYNPKTARLYTDFSYFTAREHITQEVAYLFNTMTGYGRPYKFQHLLIAPYNLHSEIQRMIDTETRNAKNGLPARIMLQINSLVDKKTINNLYRASNAGVRIDLIVRGICGLVPGVPEVSETIRIRSIVGRFLEHPRVLYFENHGLEPRIYLGSADWMPRNFIRRIELVFPLEDPELRRRIIDEFIPIIWRDNIDAKELQPTGAYLPVPINEDEERLSAQSHFLQALAMKKESNDEGYIR